MSKRYSHLLSPLKIGNIVLKNRTCFPNASPHFLQGPETFPAEPFMAFYTNLAKNGAAYIDLAEWNNPDQRKFGAADRFFLVGDCESVSNIQRCMRSAYSKATLI